MNQSVTPPLHPCTHHLGAISRKKHLLRFLVAIALLAFANGAAGQTFPAFPDYPSNASGYTEWNNQTAGTYKISSNKTLDSQINLSGNLTLYPVGNVTITRGDFGYKKSEAVFVLTGEHSLSIIGDDSNKLTFNGGAENLTSGDNAGMPHPDRLDTGKHGAAIRLKGTGTLTLSNILFEQFATHWGDSDETAGVITLYHSNVDENYVGKCQMKDVEMRYCYAGDAQIKTYDPTKEDRFGRVFSITQGYWHVYMEKVEIHHCIVNEGLQSAYMGGTASSPHNNIQGMGGVIRTQGNVGGSLTLKKCKIHDNQYRDLSGGPNYSGSNYTAQRYYEGLDKVKDRPLSGQGGAINHRSGARPSSNDPLPPLTITDCEFIRNCAKYGGAISNNASMTIAEGDSHTYIAKNQAEQGGGIYFWTYNANQDTYDGEGFNAVFGSESAAGDRIVSVYDNYAKEVGGGIYITMDPSNDVGYDANTNAQMDAHFYIRFYKGSDVQYNRAPKGAGIAIVDNCAKKHKAAKGNGNYNNQVPQGTWSGEYMREINFHDCKVWNNRTLVHIDDVIPDTVAGGGIYIAKQRSTNTYFQADFDDNENGAGGTLTVNLYKGSYEQNHAISGKFDCDWSSDYENPFNPDNDVLSNKPGLGGGFYIANPLKKKMATSYLFVNIGKDEAHNSDLLVKQNRAYTDGGGFYIIGGKVTVQNGVIGTNKSPTVSNYTEDTYRDDANKALNGNGGGLYISVANADETTTVKNAYIDCNTAKLNGGGFYVNEGIVNIGAGGKDTRIRGNLAAQDHGGGVYLRDGIVTAANSRINWNIATTNGGGINNHAGDIIIQGGELWKNIAETGRGGGIYTNAGDITVEKVTGASDGLNEYSEIHYNTAKLNGGGVNTHIGQVDIRYASIHHNIAGHDNGNGNGGAVYCHAPAVSSGFSVRLLKTDMRNNTANGDGDTGGHGGGIYAFGGSFFMEHSKIVENKASGNGGGMCNEEGGVYAYGTLIHNNEAEKDGGGVFTNYGFVEVGPCDAYGETSSKSCLISQNKAGDNGGGIANQFGSILIQGDKIEKNTATNGKGGGVYLADAGYIQMFGGIINENHADHISDGYGGGVYCGGEFLIEEYTERSLVKILDIKQTACDKFTVHYHIVDKAGKPSTVEHGIKFSKDVDPVEPELAGDITRYAFDEACSGVSFESTPEEGCYRITVENSTTAEELMFFQAYFGDKTSYVEGFYFEGAGPIVFTGMAYDITTDAVTLIGRAHTLGCPGASTIDQYQRGFQIVAWPLDEQDNDPNWNDATTYFTNSAGVQSEVLGDVFYITVTGLNPGTTYAVRAIARLGGNDYHGAETSFTTKPSGSKMVSANKPRSVYPAVEENPFFVELSPMQQALLASTPEADTTAKPNFRDDPALPEPRHVPQINKNTAAYGGGVCVDQAGAQLIFSGTKGNINPTEGKGQINLNYASQAGGGIYVGRQSMAEYAQMQMMGKCEVNYNHVPYGKQGGGIYLDGRFYVGDKADDSFETHGLFVDYNFANGIDQDTWVNTNFSTTASSSLGQRNNVFLPRNDYIFEDHENNNANDNKISVITLLSDIAGFEDKNNNGTFDSGVDESYSHIGFSVLKGFCPVIATSDEMGGDYANVQTTDVDSPDTKEKWLYDLMKLSKVNESDGTAEKLTGAIFEDSESYVAIHTRQNMRPFLGKFIYLWGCWTHPVVRFDPEQKQPMVGSTNLAEPHEDLNWMGHYVIRNPGENKEDGSGAPLEWDIYSAEGLAWFTSYVNGLNVFDEASGGYLFNEANGTYYGAADGDDKKDPNHFKWNKDKNPKAVARIMNDLDMSAYLWVPIGSVQKFYNNVTGSESLFNDSEEDLSSDGYTQNKHYYRGQFDGQGHIIKGIQGLYLTGIQKFGLFGYLAEGAVVKNTFVDDGVFVSDNNGVVYSAGGIAGEMKEGSQLFNSEARMNFDILYSASETSVGGLVGRMEGGNVHSSMAMPTISTSTETTEQYVGGLVGWMKEGTSLKNSFANVEFLTEPKYKIGGIVGHNNGIIENVYVRYNNAENTPKYGSTIFPVNIFYWIAGKNQQESAVRYCFTPKDKSGAGSGKWYYCNGKLILSRRGYAPTKLESGKYGFAQKDQEVSCHTASDDSTFLPTKSGLTYDNATHKSSLNGLMGALNNWVAAKNAITDTQDPDYKKNYALWTRTMASSINGDYPVPMYDDFSVVGSEDGIYMKYDDKVDDMWKIADFETVPDGSNIINIPELRTGKSFEALNIAPNKGKAAMYLYHYNGTPKSSESSSKSTYLPIGVSGNTYVPLHIHEDIGVTQTDGAQLTARVGITFDNTDCSTDFGLGGKAYDWHMFGSALTAAPTGITHHSHNKDSYTGGKEYSVLNNYASLIEPNPGITHGNWSDRDYMDPPVITWNKEEGTIGYFPTNTPYGQWGKESHWPKEGEFGKDSFDFYALHEQSRHWVNFKREGTDGFMDHWHQDVDANGMHKHLTYYNETELIPGKGYMMGVSKTSMLMADGVLNNGNSNGNLKSTYELSNTPYYYIPTSFSEALRGINLVSNPFQSYLDFDMLATANAGIIHGNGYYLFDADAKRYLCYAAGASENYVDGPGVLHPHQGFLVYTAESGSYLTFTNDMRSETGKDNSYFRSERRNYPLVNLFCYDPSGYYDVTTVEMNRPEQGGNTKLKDVRNGNSLIYARMDDNDYQTLFAPIGTETVPVRFQASENGVYTMRWDMLHGNFSYLHLIDNMTGADVDCLTQGEYRFQANILDYSSRFKLVFDVAGIDEQQSEETASFAFQMGDEIVVNGEGVLSVFDITGRQLLSRSLKGAQNSVSLPGVASGLYILRLAGDKQVKVQKMIVK